MKETPVMNARISTLLKLLVSGLLVLLAVDLQAQLIFKTKFSAVEGYTNGWMIGQPSVGNKWLNANADWSYDPSGAYTSLNNGCSWWPEGWTEPWYLVKATNTTAAGGGQMLIASDGNFGTNAQTYFFKMDFPTGNQMAGPITCTWDWQFHCTNVIPADYDPYTNTYDAELPGFDHGFTLSDYANRTAEIGDVGDTIPNPNWKYSELSTPFRLSHWQDGRHNPQGTCGGSGGWNDYGPTFKDGKLLHMKLVIHCTNEPAIGNTYDGFCQRDGETNWQTTFAIDTDVEWVKPDGFGGTTIEAKTIPASGMRRCAGETDPTSGINCLMLWLNGNQYPNQVLVSNIRVVGPNAVPAPVVSVTPAGVVTFTAGSWLEEADSLSGPWTTVSVKAPYQVPGGSGKKFYRANN
jgi:hypothetical protein